MSFGRTNCISWSVLDMYGVTNFIEEKYSLLNWNISVSWHLFKETEMKTFKSFYSDCQCRQCISRVLIFTSRQFFKFLRVKTKLILSFLLFFHFIQGLFKETHISSKRNISEYWVFMRPQCFRFIFFCYMWRLFAPFSKRYLFIHLFI